MTDEDAELIKVPLEATADHPYDQPKPAEEEKPKAVENDEESEKRRAAEFASLHATHMANINRAHELYPTPNKKFEHFTSDEQTRWGQKRSDIDMANRAYFNAVRATHQRHEREEAERVARINAKRTEEAA